MGHWEQVGVENRRRMPIARWRRIGVGVLVVAVTAILYVLMLVPFWQ